MTKEISKHSKADYLRFKCEWSKLGSPGEFFEWLIERIHFHSRETEKLKTIYELKEKLEGGL